MLLPFSAQRAQRLQRNVIYHPVNSKVEKGTTGTTQALIKDVCRGIPPDKYSDWTRSPEYFVAPVNNLSFCTMHSAMDDVWARMFEIFINASKASEYLKPRFPRVHKLDLIKQLETIDIENSQTVLYVRNPYARLFLLYVDRFHLVTAHSQNEKWCENITFQYFLDKVITHVKLRQDWGMSWASPLVPKCRLCDINLFSVIREEYFNQDIRDFVQKLSNSDQDFVKDIEILLKPVILLHSTVVAKLNFRNPMCMHMESKFKPLLWRSLQYMGYVNNSVKYPEELDSVDVAFHPHILVKSVLKAGNISTTDKEIFAQRQIILAEAYRDIKEETIEYIQNIYKYDFEMFGYSKMRP